MKLLYCEHCQDARKLLYDMTRCMCGRSRGYYKKDGLNAVVGGDARVLGFANSTLAGALRDSVGAEFGAPFHAFVIPEPCPTVRREK